MAYPYEYPDKVAFLDGSIKSPRFVVFADKKTLITEDHKGGNYYVSSLPYSGARCYAYLPVPNDLLDSEGVAVKIGDEFDFRSVDAEGFECCTVEGFTLDKLGFVWVKTDLGSFTSDAFTKCAVIKRQPKPLSDWKDEFLKFRNEDGASCLKLIERIIEHDRNFGINLEA